MRREAVGPSIKSFHAILKGPAHTQKVNMSSIFITDNFQ